MNLSRRKYLLFLCGLLAGCRKPTPSKPLSISFWHWHHPFALSEDTQKTLHEMGVTELFVHCGTVRVGEIGESDDAKVGKPYRVVAQQWQSGGTGFGVHLVYNAATNLLRDFEKTSMEEIASVVIEAFQKDSIAAEKTGAKVVGLQLDFDFPTRLLPRYAELLQLVKAKLNSPTSLLLSIAVLTTWYTSKSFSVVLSIVDFAVPQFYEGALPHDFAHLVGITSPDHLRRGLISAEWAGKPFRAGLAAYGHALVFDNAGRLRGSFKDAGAETLLKDRNFRCLSVAPDEKSKEQFVTFTAATNAPKPSSPEALDYRLVFDLPTVASLARQLQFVRDNRPSNCDGVIIFRLPEATETATLPLVSVQALWANEKPQIAPNVKITTRPTAPYRSIEDPKQTPAMDVFISVTNTGNAPTLLAPESVVLTMHLEKPGVESVKSGSFIASSTHFAQQNASLARSDTLKFTAPSLAPNQTRTIGPIQLPIIAESEAISSFAITWEIRGESGTITGKMAYPTPKL
jgi:hypothetical protein